MIRIAVAGAGNMAHIRTCALLNTNNVELCGVAARHLESAKKFADNFHISFATTDYRELIKQKPDAILIELPHKIQDEVVLWSLNNKLHTLIGGCLATTSQVGKQIATLADQKKLVVECGYEARYKPCLRYVKEQLDTKFIGAPCLIEAIALWDAPRDSWYRKQDESGGMPVTHMTYAFLNPLRWFFGEPLRLSAMANRVKQINLDSVNEETCLVNLQFPDDLLVSLTAGYVTAPMTQHWKLEIFGSEGMLEIHPGDLDSGYVRHHTKEHEIVTHSFSDSENAFDIQAKVFIDSISAAENNADKTSSKCLNLAQDSIKDIELAEAIVHSTKSYKVIIL